jgi:hypothetical protein
MDELCSFVWNALDPKRARPCNHHGQARCTKCKRPVCVEHRKCTPWHVDRAKVSAA